MEVSSKSLPIDQDIPKSNYNFEKEIYTFRVLNI